MSFFLFFLFFCSGNLELEGRKGGEIEMEGKGRGGKRLERCKKNEEREKKGNE